MILWWPTRPSRTNTKKKDVLFIIGDWIAKVGGQKMEYYFGLKKEGNLRCLTDTEDLAKWNKAVTKGQISCDPEHTKHQDESVHRDPMEGVRGGQLGPEFGKTETSWGWMVAFFSKQSECTQSCLTLCDPRDCSSSVHGILQARLLEWILIPCSRASSPPRDWTWISCTEGRFFIIWATRDIYSYHNKVFFLLNVLELLVWHLQL